MHHLGKRLGNPWEAQAVKCKPTSFETHVTAVARVRGCPRALAQSLSHVCDNTVDASFEPGQHATGRLEHVTNMKEWLTYCRRSTSNFKAWMVASEIET